MYVYIYICIVYTYHAYVYIYIYIYIHITYVVAVCWLLCFVPSAGRAVREDAGGLAGEHALDPGRHHAEDVLRQTLLIIYCCCRDPKP